MTIRQMLLAGGGVAASTQAFKGVATASSSSVSLPSHAANDLIVIIAANLLYEGSNPIAVPDGYTEIRRITDGSGFREVVVGFKKAVDGSETSGTWTNSSRILAGVWDGFSGIGGSASQKSLGSTVYWPAVSMSISNGTSWVVGMIYAEGIVGDLTSAPTGMTHRGASTRMALHDTAGGVASWSQKTTTIGDSGGRYVFTFELVAE